MSPSRKCKVLILSLSIAYFSTSCALKGRNETVSDANFQEVEVLYKKDSTENITVTITKGEILMWTYPKKTGLMTGSFSTSRFAPPKGTLDSIQLGLEILKSKNLGSITLKNHQGEIDFVFLKDPVSDAWNVDTTVLSKQDMVFIKSLRIHFLRKRYQTNPLPLADSIIYLCPTFLE